MGAFCVRGGWFAERGLLRRVQAALCGRIRRRRGHRHAAARVRPCEADREEMIDQGGVGAMGRPRGNSRYPRVFKLRVVEAYLLGEGDRRALALEHGVRNGAQTRDRAKRRRGGGDDAPAVHPPGRRRKEPAGEEALDRRCARLEMEAGILRRTAASAAALSAAGGSTRRRSRRGGNIRSPRSRSSSGCRAPPIAATRRAPLGQAGGRAAGHSGDMREIPVRIRMPTRCRHVAQSGRHSHRRQDGAQGRARGGAAAPD